MTLKHAWQDTSADCESGIPATPRGNQKMGNDFLWPILKGAYKIREVLCEHRQRDGVHKQSRKEQQQICIRSSLR